MCNFFSMMILLLSVVLLGCQDRSWVYTPIVTQGRPITEQQIHHLKLGLSQATVTKQLGTPALINPLNPNEWIYLSTERRQLHLTHIQPTQVKLIFKHNQLSSIQRTVS